MFSCMIVFDNYPYQTHRIGIPNPKIASYKARGSVWHQKNRKANHIPEGGRNLDTDASWSTSKYCGWIYSYGVHLTTTANGFPILANVRTASVNEKQDLIKRLRHFWREISNMSWWMSDIRYKGVSALFGGK